jgi:hypothetical protein
MYPIRPLESEALGVRRLALECPKSGAGVRACLQDISKRYSGRERVGGVEEEEFKRSAPQGFGTDWEKTFVPLRLRLFLERPKPRDAS